eukprot:TRINITY_DN28770_c0_g1_i1.p1 TRINITY_DN28770_c0_g1~~TRINITY_DN28770_c0_g1_i1.p1  ORF type:complete len:462 (-),score=48.40 TRINITY_DN28770_c0_g1_i1:119-1504(-)
MAGVVAVGSRQMSKFCEPRLAPLARPCIEFGNADGSDSEAEDEMPACRSSASRSGQRSPCRRRRRRAHSLAGGYIPHRIRLATEDGGAQTGFFSNNGFYVSRALYSDGSDEEDAADISPRLPSSRCRGGLLRYEIIGCEDDEAVCVSKNELPEEELECTTGSGEETGGWSWPATDCETEWERSVTSMSQLPPCPVAAFHFASVGSTCKLSADVEEQGTQDAVPYCCDTPDHWAMRAGQMLNTASTVQLPRATRLQEPPRQQEGEPAFHPTQLRSSLLASPSSPSSSAKLEEPSKVMTGLASILRSRIYESEAEKASTISSSESSETLFDTGRSPLSVEEYLARICEYTECSQQALVIALVYMERIVSMHSAYELNSITCHRLLLTSLMLACKYHDGGDDVPYQWSNSTWAKVGGILVEELNTLESLMLQLLQWKLFVKPEEYEVQQRTVIGAVSTTCSTSG